MAQRLSRAKVLAAFTNPIRSDINAALAITLAAAGASCTGKVNAYHVTKAES